MAQLPRWKKSEVDGGWLAGLKPEKKRKISIDKKVSGPIIKKNNKWKREERKLTKEILFYFSFLQKKRTKETHTHR